VLRPLLTNLALIVLPVAALAQAAPTVPAPPPAGASAPGIAPAHHHHGPRYLAALRRLDLTPDQKQQIAGYVRQMRAAERANAQRLHQQLDGVLTPDQRTQLQSSLQQTRSEGSRPQ
jgi:Spy/CpxP family protein refolding chaperone